MKPSKATRSKAIKFARWIEKNYCKPIKRSIGYCEICGNSGKQYQLHAHHIYGKKSMLMRVEMDNLICLCSVCHTQGAHGESYDAQKDFHAKLEAYLGKDFLKALERKKNSSSKMTLLELEELYETLKEKQP